MRKFIGKSNERILYTLSQSEILRLYSIVYVAMKTTKTSKSFISIFFTCQVSASDLQPSWFSCHDLANDIYSETAKTVFSHLKHQSTTINKLLILRNGQGLQQWRRWKKPSPLAWKILLLNLTFIILKNPWGKHLEEFKTEIMF